MSTNSANPLDAYRWLDPFASQHAEMVTAKQPDEIEAALRPELFDIRWRHLPFMGFFGHVEPWGFVLERHSRRLPVLTARYQPSDAGTHLALTVKRNAAGLASWAWNLLAVPFMVVGLMAALLRNGIDASSTGAVLMTGIGPLLVCVLATVGVSGYLRTSYRHRNDLNAYQTQLSELIEARPTDPQA